MNNVKKIYINPQWQGGADLSTYVGAEEIKEYLAGQDFVTLPVLYTVALFILLLRILCFLNEAIPTFRHQTQLLVQIEWAVKQKIPRRFEMNCSSTRSL